MKKVFLGCLSFALLLTAISCDQKAESKYPGYEEVESGLYVKYYTKNEEGRTVNVGDIITLYMNYTTEDDSVLFDSSQDPRPVQMRADSGKFEGDFMGVFIGMNEGDSVSVMVNADTFYIKSAGYPETPPFIDSASMLKFTLAVRKVETMEEIEAQQAEANKAGETEEMAILEEYLTANNITTAPTASGLIVIPTKEGSGSTPQAGQEVSVNYKGYLIDGRYFDTSIEEVAKEKGVYNPGRTYEPFTFTLGQGQVIPGWDEGIQQIAKGGEATLIIPSKLAYGANPRPGGVIQPFNTLIFEVELVDFK